MVDVHVALDDDVAPADADVGGAVLDVRGHVVRLQQQHVDQMRPEPTAPDEGPAVLVERLGQRLPFLETGHARVGEELADGLERAPLRQRQGQRRRQASASFTRFTSTPRPPSFSSMHS